MVALVSDVKAPDFSKYEAEASTLRSKLVQQKERDLSDTWLKSLTAKAKIERNDAVLSDAVEDNG